MFSTLRKLGHKRRLNRKEKKDKKNREMLSGGDKLKSTARSSFDLCGDSMPPFDPTTARRHSCFSAFIDVPTDMLRRGSNLSQDCSSCTGGGSKCRRGSSASTASTASAESYRVKRLTEIAQLDRYVENLKKSADSDNLSYIPNRLCVALLLKSVLQRRERQYMYEYLHSNRCSSESDVSMKSQREVDLTLSDVNNNNNDNSNDHDNNNNNHISSNNSVDRSNANASSCQSLLKKKLYSRDVKSKKYDHDNSSSEDRRFKSIDTSEEEEEEEVQEERMEPEERVPGALLKAYQLELSGHSVDSDSEMEVSRHHRYRKRSDSKTRRKSVALYPQNYEIY